MKQQTRNATAALSAAVLVSLGAALLVPATGHADKWAAPRPRLAAAPRGEWALVVVPDAKDPFGGPAVGRLLRLGPSGNTVLVRRFRLRSVPAEALVGDNGEVATLDTYGSLGYAHAVVVYGPDGKVLADYKLEDLLTPAELAKVPQTASSRPWRADRTARIEEGAGGPTLVIPPSNGTAGRTLRVDLKTGKLAR